MSDVLVEQPAAPAASQDPTPTTPPVQPSSQGGPWMSDLEATFTDPTTRAQVSEFLGQKVQPYVTRVEQQRAEAAQAAEFVREFEADPAGTYLAITEDLFGEEATPKIREVIASLYGEEETEPAATEPAATTAEPGAEPAAPTDPRLEKAFAFIEQQEQKQMADEYNSSVAKIAEENPHVDADLFHPFVVQTGGDLDGALTAYNVWAQKAGLLKEPDPTPTPEPPAVLGSDSTTTPTPPTIKDYGSDLNAAIDDLFDVDLKAPAPPVVGGV